MHLQRPSESPVPQLPQQSLGQELSNVQLSRSERDPTCRPYVPQSTPNIPQTASGVRQGAFPLSRSHQQPNAGSQPSSTVAPGAQERVAIESGVTRALQA
ncbi:unnamed protein product [Chondrus crispus]|uniref:Uncharacterized protein n=1 Tax=Chondrus crispus TaxID=2769 RepID=R7QLV2_CHOCR|nr:unnamed protein product [Chondrus crispus]CDF38370.1 unnamed protein product [Chondrus crispus]|eukprot:XP_005718255.1 unnamed protein product [Chondrus crispus]